MKSKSDIVKVCFGRCSTKSNVSTGPKNKHSSALDAPAFDIQSPLKPLYKPFEEPLNTLRSFEVP